MLINVDLENRSPDSISAEQKQKSSPPKAQGFKLNLMALRTIRNRKKNKYEVMLDDLKKLKSQATMKNILTGFPVSKVGDTWA